MKHALNALALPDSPPWIWAPEIHSNQTILFRSRIHGLADYEAVSIQLAASTRYYLWADAQYLGQGPCPTPWPDNTVDGYAVNPQNDALTLAIIVHHNGVKTQSHPDCPPGLWVRLIGKKHGAWETIELPMENWKYSAQGGWIHTNLRRTWATGWMEQFDAAKHPNHWQNPDFDDSHWNTPTTIERSGSTLTPRMTPALREWFVPASKLRAAAKVSKDAPIADHGEGLLSKLLDEEAWELIETQDLQTQWDSGNGIRVESDDDGLALLFDMGEEVVGQTEFTIDAASGMVDHYGAELLRDGRPWVFRGNAEYATRWFASDNASDFRTLNYNGFRYLLIVLRPDKSAMHLKHFGVWRREADIQLTNNYHSEDPVLQRLWDNSIRTIQVSTQETNVDCPTREQALFIADGLWNALWVSKLYDESSYFEHFLDVTAKAQCDNGLMPSAVFSSLVPPHFLLDFCLIYVWGVDVFRRAHPEKLDVVRKHLPTLEKVLHWYEGLINDAGIIEVEPKIINNVPGGQFQIVFIDHPGLWHTFSHPGLERGTRQLGLNAYLAIALDSFHTCAQACDYTHSLNTTLLDSTKIRQQCQALFWNQETQYYADCLSDETGQFSGWSVQSQVLAVLSGILTGDEAKTLMLRIVEARHHPELCRCTPYFWTYFAEALIITGLKEQVMPLITEAWSVMLDDPETTTWWETFENKPGDTRCHPWSSLPAWIMQPENMEFRLFDPWTV